MKSRYLPYFAIPVFCMILALPLHCPLALAAGGGTGPETAPKAVFPSASSPVAVSSQQAGTNEDADLDIEMGAPDAASAGLLGEAGSALQDPATALWNPAAIGFLDRKTFSIHSFTGYFGDYRWEGIAFGKPYLRGAYAIGFWQASYLPEDLSALAPEQPRFQRQFVLAPAIVPNPRVSIGFLLRGFYQECSGFSRGGYSLGAGIVLYPVERVFLGASALNIANGVGKTAKTLSPELDPIERVHGGWVSPDSSITALASMQIRTGKLEDFSLGVEGDAFLLARKWLPRWAPNTRWRIVPRIGVGKKGFSVGITLNYLDWNLDLARGRKDEFKFSGFAFRQSSASPIMPGRIGRLRGKGIAKRLFGVAKDLYEKGEYFAARDSAELALAKDPTSEELLTFSGKLKKLCSLMESARDSYVAADYESSRLDYRKALEVEPRCEMCKKRSLAIEHYLEGNKKWKEGAQEDAFAEWRKALEFEPEMPGALLALCNHGELLSMEKVELDELFASIYKYYGKDKLGTVTLVNHSPQAIPGVKVSFKAAEIMDAPTEVVVDSIAPSDTAVVPIRGLFSGSVLRLSDDSSYPCEVKVSFPCGTSVAELSHTGSITMHRKGAIVWDDQRKIAAFVMPNDQVVHYFATQVSKTAPLPAKYEENWGNIPLAMKLFDAVRLYGLSYLRDPSTPFGTVWETGDRIDTVQFPRETLRFGTGDCDDLATTYASLLKAAGIDAVLYTYPGHIAPMFDSGLSKKLLPGLFLPEKLFVEYKGKLWVPVETTMLEDLFVRAWDQAAADYQYYASGGSVQLIDLAEASEIYPPGSFLDVGSPITIPSEAKLGAVYQKEVAAFENLASETIQSRLRMLEADPTNPAAANALAIAYGQSGQYDEAIKVIERTLASGNESAALYCNLGNLLYLKGEDVESVFENYRKAVELDPGDKAILLNYAVVSFVYGDSAQAMGLLTDVARSLPKKAVCDSLGIVNAGSFGVEAPAKLIPLKELLALLEKAEASVPEQEKMTASAEVRPEGEAGTVEARPAEAKQGKGKVPPHVPAGLRSADRATAIAARLYWKLLR